MIVYFFALLMCNSLYIYGLYEASHFEYISKDNPKLGVIEKSKMILWKFRWLSEKYLGMFYSKPLFSCPTCMASVHSSYIFWPLALMVYDFTPMMILIYILYVGTLAGLNYITGHVIDLLKSGSDYLNSH